jgi:hypothetical protein
MSNAPEPGSMKFSYKGSDEGLQLAAYATLYAEHSASPLFVSIGGKGSWTEIDALTSLLRAISRRYLDLWAEKDREVERLGDEARQDLRERDAPRVRAETQARSIRQMQVETSRLQAEIDTLLAELRIVETTEPYVEVLRERDQLRREKADVIARLQALSLEIATLTNAAKVE